MYITYEKHLYNFINEKYEFAYSCVSPEDYNELIFIKDNMKEISKTTFYKNVDIDDVLNIFDVYNNDKMFLLNDNHITYYKFNKGDVDAYIMVHSGIEYIFKNDIKKIKKDRLKTKLYNYDDDEWTNNENYRLIKSYKDVSVGDILPKSKKVVVRIFQYKDSKNIQFETNDKLFNHADTVIKYEFEK